MAPSKLTTKRLKELGINPPKNARQIKAEYTKQAKALPIETKRIFLEALHDGKTVGQARELAEIDDLMVAAQLVILCHETTTINRLKTAEEIS